MIIVYYEKHNGSWAHEVARFVDEKGVIVGLKAKGKARKDTSGFVVDVDNVIAIN